MDDVLEEINEEVANKLGDAFGNMNSNQSEKDFFGANNSFFNDDNSRGGKDEHRLKIDGCKILLYQELGNSHIRAWDFLIFIPNVLFLIFLITKFNGARRKLAGSNAPIFKAFYALIWMSSVVSVFRCVVSMGISMVGQHDGGDVTDKLLWILLRFCLLATEMSVIVFGVAAGHLDSRSSIRRVVFVSAFVSLAFSTTQALLEIKSPDPRFTVTFLDHDRNSIDLFGHGGAVFWLVSSFILSLVYFTILILPVVPMKTFLNLPQKKSFYYYVGFLFFLNMIQTIGGIMLYSTGKGSGLCIVNFTTYTYFTAFIPIVYFTFLRSFFKVAQPTLLFSYKAQVDDEEYHQSMQFSSNGFVETPANIEQDDEDASNPIVINNGVRTGETDMTTSPDNAIIFGASN